MMRCSIELFSNFPRNAPPPPPPPAAAFRLTDINLSPDAGDESLQRYKQSLGLGGGKDLSDPSDSRVCIILSLTMDSPGRAPVTIDLSQPGSETSLKDKPFKIKEGAKFTMSAQFKVQHEILSGLHYVQVVKRKGIRVSKDSEMIVSGKLEFLLLFLLLLLLLQCRICWTAANAPDRAAMLPTPKTSLPTPRNVRRHDMHQARASVAANH